MGHTIPLYILCGGHSRRMGMDKAQPLVGVYQTTLAPALYDYLASGKRAVIGFLDLIEYDTFEVTDDEIQNINTPEQYNLLLKKET